MARKAQAIYDDLTVQMGLEPTLAPLLTNPSKTAIWRLLLWVFAYGANIIEVLFDTFVTEIETKGQAAKVGNAQWYRGRILEFQYGDNLVFLNSIYQYAVLDLTKRIVTNCAVVSDFDPLVGGIISIKVAATANGGLVALDAPQIAALTSYIQKIKFAGTKIKVISTSGDIIKIAYTVYYDPIIPLSTMRQNVNLVINNYVKNLPFDGNLLITKLTDALQLVDGVNDVVFNNAASKVGTGDNYQSFDRIKNPYGGYFKISTANGETLNDTINFIAI